MILLELKFEYYIPICKVITLIKYKYYRKFISFINQIYLFIYQNVSSHLFIYLPSQKHHVSFRIIYVILLSIRFSFAKSGTKFEMLHHKKKRNSLKKKRVNLLMRQIILSFRLRFERTLV